MPRDKQEVPEEKAEFSVSSDAPELMTVEDYARLANVNAIMMAGFKAFLRSGPAKPWGTRDEWKKSMEAFSSSPA